MMRGRRLLALLFTATLFVSAGLLFWVQPLIAKILLPFLGGTPMVWNTCMLFFQGALLAGYAYALLITSRLSTKQQIALHLTLLVVAALTLPIGISQSQAARIPLEGNPIFWLLWTLALSLGLPFFVISASAPLLQRWFSKTDHPSAHDPYFLYAASNLGSFIALLSFPLLLEPRLTLRVQSRVWATSYALLVLLFAACAAMLLKSRKTETASESSSLETAEQTENLTYARRLRWVLLAFIPSSLMLGVTTYISTDIATTPLLWVIPLSLYLLSFVIVFAARWSRAQKFLLHIFPGIVTLFLLVYLSGATTPAWFIVPLHLLFFFIAAIICHGQLAAERPAPAHLAEFYLWLSIGGVMGGIFNALLAPFIFRSILEYPLVVILAVLALPRANAESTRRSKLFDILIPLGLLALTIEMTIIVPRLDVSLTEKIALAMGVPLLIAYLFLSRRPVRFALALFAVMIGSNFYSEIQGRTIYSVRNFFGVMRVARSAEGGEHELYHGNTLHGREFTDAKRQCEPLAYYHPAGPLGAVFVAFNASPNTKRVAVVGLGTGATSCYSRPGQDWTFYDINPAVVALARNSQYFTYLNNCAAVQPKIILGDARLSLRKADDAEYDLIVLDAFSSDAIPVHLITREALELYLKKLSPTGWLAFHISNRNLDLHSVLSNLARSENLQSLHFNDRDRSDESGKEASDWVVLTRDANNFGVLAEDSRWQPLEAGAGHVWTDDFSNILSVLK